MTRILPSFSHSGSAVRRLLQALANVPDLAPLHRQLDVVRPFVARDELELQAQDVPRDDDEIVAQGAGGGSPQDELGRLGVFQRFDRGRMPHIADIGIAGDAADPGQLFRVESGGLG